MLLVLALEFVLEDGRLVKTRDWEDSELIKLDWKIGCECSDFMYFGLVVSRFEVDLILMRDTCSPWGLNSSDTLMMKEEVSSWSESMYLRK